MPPSRTLTHHPPSSTPPPQIRKVARKAAAQRATAKSVEELRAQVGAKTVALAAEEVKKKEAEEQVRP